MHLVVHFMLAMVKLNPTFRRFSLRALLLGVTVCAILAFAVRSWPDGSIERGMTFDEVERRLGPPQAVGASAGIADTTWVYSDRAILFKDGVVVAWGVP